MELKELLSNFLFNETSVSFKNADSLTKGQFVQLPNVFVVWGKITPTLIRTITSLLIAERFKFRNLTQTQIGLLGRQSKSTVYKNLAQLVAIGACEIVRGSGKNCDRYKLNAKVRLGSKDVKTLTSLLGRVATEFEGADEFTKYGWTKVPLKFAFGENATDNEFALGLVILARTFGKGYYDFSQDELAECISTKREALKDPLASLIKKEIVKVVRIKDKNNENKKFERAHYYWLLDRNESTTNGNKGKKGNKQRKKNEKENEYFGVLTAEGLTFPYVMLGSDFNLDEFGVKMASVGNCSIGVKLGELGDDGVLTCVGKTDSNFLVPREEIEETFLLDFDLLKLDIAFPIKKIECKNRSGYWFAFTPEKA